MNFMRQKEKSEIKKSERIRLSVFEEYMFLDSTPAFPMEPIIRLIFLVRPGFSESSFEILQKSFYSVLERHPLFQKIVVKENRHYYWKSTDVLPSWNALPEKEYQTCADGTPDFYRYEFEFSALNLTNEPGIRIHSRFWAPPACSDRPKLFDSPKTEDRMDKNGQKYLEIVVQFHHCCADGLGFLKFFQDWMTFFRNQFLFFQKNPEKHRRLSCLKMSFSDWESLFSSTDNSAFKEVLARNECSSPQDDLTENLTKDLTENLSAQNSKYLPFQKISTEKIFLRDTFGIGFKRYLRIAKRGITTTLALLFRYPRAMLKHRLIDFSEPVSAQYPAVESFELNQEETEQYRQKAKKKGVSFNDLLMQDLFLSIDEFRRTFDLSQNGWTRLSMPINVRESFHEDAPAADIVSMVFLDRRHKQFKNREKLLQGIRREVLSIRNYDQGLSLIINLRVKRYLPGGISSELKSRRCRATSVLSNLGQPFSAVLFPKNQDGKLQICDSLLLDGISAVPPLRRQTLTSLAVITYAGKLSFAVRYEDRIMSSEQIAAFIQIYKTQMKND